MLKNYFYYAIIKQKVGDCNGITRITLFPDGLPEKKT